MRIPAILAVFSAGLVVAACGASDDGGQGESGTPASAPAPGAPIARPAGGEAEAPAAPPPAPSSRARCGAAPYSWVVTPALGDVLESESKAGHTKIDLAYVILDAKNKGAFKTTRLPKHGTKSKLVRYQTQDRGKLLDATTLVAYPSDAGTYPILLVLHGTAGFNDACAPSRGALEDSLDGFTDGTSVLLSVFASLGYVAVAPDYIGLKSLGTPTGFLHPYLVGEPTAIASLDAVRAAKKLLAGSDVMPGDVVVVGGSQGGHAAAFVNRFAPHYAPELAIKGSVWDVPPTDLAGEAVPALAADVSATKNMVAVSASFASWYGIPVSTALASPYDVAVPQALATSCSPGDALAGASRTSLFTAAFLSSSGTVAPWDCALAENSLPTTSVPRLDDIPSLFLLGEKDELVNDVVERASFTKLCAQGLRLSYLECAGASHTKPFAYALDQWLDFLEARLKGEPLASYCTVKPAETCTSTP